MEREQIRVKLARGGGERCPELSQVELILTVIVSRSLWIRVMDAIENNLPDGLWRKMQNMDKPVRLSGPTVEI